MYSGESAMPTMRSRFQRPLITAPMLSPDLQAVGLGEGLADDHLVVAARLDVPPARAGAGR